MQTRLPITVSHRTVFVDTATVRTILGVDADSIAAMVDDGRLLWVWDISTGAVIRELRFWIEEIQSPQTARALTLDQVIERVLPAKLMFHGSEVSQHLLISRPMLGNLRSAMSGQIVGPSTHIPRQGLINFLRSRWVGATVATTRK